MKKLYLANGYGFSEQQSKLLDEIIREIESLNIEVYEPFDRNNDVEFNAYKIGQKNFEDIRECDGVFAIVNGCPPDEGVCIEIGYAYALGKTIFLFRDDFRRCADSEEYPLNLQIFSCLPEYDWDLYYYKSVDDIKSPIKHLYHWS